VIPRFSIACASIFQGNPRPDDDRTDKTYPEYKFAEHKGYWHTGNTLNAYDAWSRHRFTAFFFNRQGHVIAAMKRKLPVSSVRDWRDF